MGSVGPQTIMSEVGAVNGRVIGEVPVRRRVAQRWRRGSRDPEDG